MTAQRTRTPEQQIHQQLYKVLDLGPWTTPGDALDVNGSARSSPPRLPSSPMPTAAAAAAGYP
jgi:hypothetical protein